MAKVSIRVVFGLFTVFGSILGTKAFSLYPTVDPDILAKALNISNSCLSALNETVNCDNDLFQWTVTVDDHWWEPENLTQLCTSQCSASASTWLSDVLATCVNDDLVIQGRSVPAATVAERFVEGLGVACLQSSGTWCTIESQNWQGSDIVRPDCTVEPSDPSCLSGDLSNVTSDNARLSHLYSDEMLCSDCFVQLFHLRLSSNYLPDDDYSDYLVEQFQDIQDVCSTTVGAISTRFFAGYNSASITINSTEPTSSVPTTTTVSSITSTTPTAVTTPTPIQSGITTDCNKFVLAVAGVSTCFDIANNNSITLQDFYEWNPAVGTNCENLWGGYYYCVGVQLAPGSTSSSACQMANLTIGISKDPAANCENLSLKYNVTTGDLLKVATDESCYLETAVCVPPPCNLVQVPDGSTCDSLATSFSVPGAPLNVTKQMVLSWNPNIIGPCDNLTAAQYVCAGAPGGSYEPPAIAPPNVGAGGQERGGPGGSDPTAITGTPTIIVTSGANINPTEAPKPTQAGSIVGNCNQYDQAETGETCTSFATRNGITPAQLYSWNSILGASGASCATDFWAGYYYCIGTTGSLPPTTTSTTRTSNTPVSAPGPTQSGITASCDSFAEAVAGQTCTVFASAHGITTSELYAWNPVLGTNGANCATSFWAEEWYCVGVSNSAKMVRDTVDVERPWLKYRRGLE